MPKDNPTAVTPKPGYHDYVDENLSIVEIDSDNLMPGCEQDFQSRASLQEGVGGLKSIDTTYENYSESIVECPRSDGPDNKASPTKPAPYPMDLGRYPHRRT